MLHIPIIFRYLVALIVFDAVIHALVIADPTDYPHYTNR